MPVNETPLRKAELRLIRAACRWINTKEEVRSVRQWLVVEKELQRSVTNYEKKEATDGR